MRQGDTHQSAPKGQSSGAARTDGFHAVVDEDTADDSDGRLYADTAGR